jgi:hypothetical protein
MMIVMLELNQNCLMNVSWKRIILMKYSLGWLGTDESLPVEAEFSVMDINLKHTGNI